MLCSASIREVSSCRKWDKLQRPTATYYAEVRVLGRLRPKWDYLHQNLRAQGTLLRKTPRPSKSKWTNLLRTHRGWSIMLRSCMVCTWPVYILASSFSGGWFILRGISEYLKEWVSDSFLCLFLSSFPCLFEASLFSNANGEGVRYRKEGRNWKE